jgi:hypothetical protein
VVVVVLCSVGALRTLLTMPMQGWGMRTIINLCSPMGWGMGRCILVLLLALALVLVLVLVLV